MFLFNNYIWPERWKNNGICTILQSVFVWRSFLNGAGERPDTGQKNCNLEIPLMLSTRLLIGKVFQFDGRVMLAGVGNVIDAPF